MSITSKVAAVLLIVFAALTGGAWLVLQTSVQPRFEQQEADAHELDRSRVEANLEAIVADLRTRVIDYARWDDTYRYMLGENPRYIDRNFRDPDWLSTYGADLALFFDDRGALLWSRQTGPNGITEADAELARVVFRQIRGHRGLDALGGAVWSEDAGPMMFAAARATDTDGAMAPHGYVVFGRRLDTGALSQQTQLDLQFLASADGERAWSPRTHRHSLIPLLSARGDEVGGVVARSERRVSALGAQTVYVTVGFLAFVFAGALCALWLLLRRVVVARLENMERHFQAQADILEPLPLDGGQDEISKLAAAYNAIVDRIAEADARASQATHESEAAAAANRMKSDFLANISYELRTPLNDVIGYAGLIQEDLHDRGDTNADADLARITGAANGMMSLLGELLDLSRIEAERLEIVAEPFDAEEAFLSAAAAAKPSAKAHNASLKVYAVTNLGQANTDQNRLRQCLVNVLTHASRRSQNGGLSMRADRIVRKAGDLLRFEIADSGPTLTDAQLAGLFEPFLREDDERLSGARLGLAVTRRLAELLGGSFEVHKRTTGCAYVLTVPARYGDQWTPQDTETRLTQRPAFAA